MKGGEGVEVEQTPSWAPSRFLHSGKQSDPRALPGSMKSPVSWNKRRESHLLVPSRSQAPCQAILMNDVSELSLNSWGRSNLL